MLPRRDSKPLEYAALLPMFGGMEKKPRFLDREVITLGRARGSDICLDGNEVSALHCIIYRAADGYRVRDCGSRTGTRVNGQAAKNGLLGNGDVLQIGPFSFEVRIPNGTDFNAATDPVRVERLKRSRSHLVHLALRLRKKLLTKKPAPAPATNGHATGSATHQALGDSSPDKRAAELKAKIKQYDQKVNDLEEAEKELADEQEALKKQKREYEEQTKARAAELAQRIDAEVEQRCAALQAEFQALKSAAPVAVGPGPEQLQELQNLQAKKHELEALEKKLKARDKELNDDYKEIIKERDQVEKAKQQWEREQSEARQQIERQKETISCAEFTLHDQKSQLGTMIEQLKKMQDDLRSSAHGEAAQLKEQVVELKRELAEAKANKPDAPVENGEVVELREKLAAAQADVEVLSLTLQQTHSLNNEVQVLQKDMQATQAKLQQELQLLSAENEMLRKLVAEGPAPDSLGAETADRLAQLQSENESLRKLAEELQQVCAESSHGGQENPELLDLKKEVQSLRTQLASAEMAAAAKPANDADDEIRQENKVLRRLLDEAEADLKHFKDAPAAAPQQGSHEVELLQKELQDVRAELLEKAKLIDELKVDAKSVGGDPESYEADLNRFRKELEADRTRLNKEIESLRVRNQELDDATREMEMELSRERAEMGRERIRLDRMRDEVKADMERLQREHEVRGTLGGVQKLRDEIVQKNGPPKSAADRLRTMSKLP
jgi:pSer/pThr/pTyr-binding forkhead associated (FHA) protein